MKTTVNIDVILLAQLEASSRKSGVSKNELVILLLTRVVFNRPLTFKMFQGVRYQERQEKENWHCLHVLFSGAFYEHCLDLRKFYKASLSLILAIAIDLFLDEIEKELITPFKKKIKSDNYLSNYTFIVEDEQNIPHFHIYWGFP